MTRVLVCGGCHFNDRKVFYDALDGLHQRHVFSVVISGGAPGADSLAIEWAMERYVQFEIYRSDWKTLGSKAGPIRNKRMLDEGKPDLVVAFPGGHGTANMVKQARDRDFNVLQLVS